MGNEARGIQLLAEINGKLDYVLKSVGDGKQLGGVVGVDGEVETAPPDVDVFKMTTRLQTLVDPQELLEAIMDTMIYVSKAERGFLMLIEEGRKLRFKVGRAIDQQGLQTDNAKTSRSIIKQVITTGQPVLINDTKKQGVTSTSISGLQLRTELCVPMRFGTREAQAEGAAGPQVGGVIYLDSRMTRHELTQRELELVMVLADQATITIENSRLIERSEDSRVSVQQDQGQILKLKENITRLLEVGRAISSTLVLDDLFVLIVDKVLEVTRAERGYIMLLDDDNKPVFKIGRAAAPSGMKPLEETSFFFSRTITGRALNEGRSICLTDAMGSDSQDASVSIMQMELQSVMCVPLMEKGQTLGLIYVDSKASNKEFEQSDLELFEALSGQAAIALKNAMLYEAAKEKERIESELAIASGIQQDILPKEVPVVDGLDLFGYMKPAKEVSGDYYDFMPDVNRPGEAVTVCIGDVSGKGVPAGLVMVMARCFLKSLVDYYGPSKPRDMLVHLNSILVDEVKPGMFMTMLLIGWDKATGDLLYSSAGHEHIIFYRAATKEVEARQSGGAALGISQSSEKMIEENVLDLAVGDTAVLYTDGVTEAMDENEVEWEMENFLASVKKHGHLPAKEIVDGVLAEIAEHRGKAAQSDDITMVVVKRI